MHRWDDDFKQTVISSRIETTKALANAIKRMKEPPEVFVTISGVGFYPPSPTKEYTEDSEGGDDFMAKLCKDWEKASYLPPELGVRNVIIRSGVVLGKYGGLYSIHYFLEFFKMKSLISGMIKQIYFPFYMGLGGPIGTGKQYFPWIHIDDMVNLFMFAIEEKHVTGVLNGVAPQIITNSEFTKGLNSFVEEMKLKSLPFVSCGTKYVEAYYLTSTRVCRQITIRTRKGCYDD